MNKQKITVALVVTFLVTVTCLLIYAYRHTIVKKVGATVIEHNVTADKYGNRAYTTLLKTDDGYVEEEKDLSTYVVPVGTRIIITVTRQK